MLFRSQETTTTTISSTTTTTASSTLPLNSDSEPTMYSKSMHYRGTNSSSAKNTHLELENGHNSSSNNGGRQVSGGRSSSLSSNSSANGQTLNHKSSHHANMNGASSNGRAGATAAAAAGATGSFANHHQNGSNASLPPGGGGGGATRGGVGSTERQPRSGAHDPAEFSSGAHSWPILFAVLPPLGALVFGKSDIFSDILTLTLIAFFLYNIIKGKKDGASRVHGSFYVCYLD